MIEKLKQMKEKFIQITGLISDPSVIADTKRWQQLCKEHANLEPIVEKFSEYEKTESDIASAESLKAIETDPEMIAMANDEIYELKDKLSVFTRTKDKHGRRTRIIRDVWRAKFHPGLPEQYIPFAKNWIVKGYIVKEGLTKMFDFKDLVGIQGYTMDVFHDEDE